MSSRNGQAATAEFRASGRRRAGIGQAGIIVVDGKLLMLNEMDELILARINSNRYEELARAPSSPANSPGRRPLCTAAEFTSATRREAQRK
jgi:hypothetical protein